MLVYQIRETPEATTQNEVKGREGRGGVKKVEGHEIKINTRLMDSLSVVPTAIRTMAWREKFLFSSLGEKKMRTEFQEEQ